MSVSTPFFGNSIYYTPWSFFWPGRRSLNKEIAAMLRAAEATSRRVLGDEYDHQGLGKYASPQSYSMRRYEELFWDFTRAAVICLAGRVGQEREIRLISGVVSFIGGLAASYFIGRHWVARAESKSEELRVQQQRTVTLPTYWQHAHQNRDMKMIQKVLGLEQKVFHKIKRNAEYGIAVKVGLFVAAIFGLIGAIMSSETWLTISVVLGITVSVAWLVGEGFNFSAGEQGRSALKMQEALEDLRLRAKW